MDFLRNAKKSRRKSQGFLYQEKLNLLSGKKNRKYSNCIGKKWLFLQEAKKKKKEMSQKLFVGW